MVHNSKTVAGPIPYTLPENAAKIFRLKLTKKDYQNERNDAVTKNYGNSYHTWDNIRNYCKTKCRPAIFSDDEMTWSSVQDNMNHQLGRQLEIDPALESTLVARHITGHTNSFVFQWGMDGVGDNRYEYSTRNMILHNQLLKC